MLIPIDISLIDTHQQQCITKR